MRLSAWILAAFLPLWPIMAYGDGIVVPDIAQVGSTNENTVQIGSQRAVLWRDGKDMVLEIEPDFQWKSGGAAWVIPLPAKPEVFIGDTRFIDDLDWLTKPRFVEATSKESCGAQSAGSNGNATPRDVAGTVQVWESGTLGNLDYVVLSGQKGADILMWLDKNGFFVPDRVKAGFKALNTKQTWFFAAKLAKHPRKGQTIGAIGFRFHDYKTPFYPVALTASGLRDGQHLDVFLVVLCPLDHVWDSGKGSQTDIVPGINGAVAAEDIFSEESITRKDADASGGSWVKALASGYETTINNYLDKPGANIRSVLEFAMFWDMPVGKLPGPVLAPGFGPQYWMWSIMPDTKQGVELVSRNITDPETIKILKTQLYIQRYHIRVHAGAAKDIAWGDKKVMSEITGIYTHWKIEHAECGCTIGYRPGQASTVILMLCFVLVLLAARKRLSILKDTPLKRDGKN